MLSEADIIALFRPDSHELDDCARIVSGPGLLLVSTDSMSENTHFRRDWSSPEDLAIKLLNVNLSDLYSSGAVPEWCLLNLGLPRALDGDFIRRFAAEFNRALASSGMRLIGGDTFAADTIQLTLTVGGRAARHIERTGGRPGDSLFVTGELGLSVAGFLSLSGLLELDPPVRDRAVQKHLRPTALAFPLSDEVHCAMDVSDGICADVRRLARASDISIRVDLEKIPRAKDLPHTITAQQVATSGEELELLFLSKQGFAGFPCTEIGRAEVGSGVAFYLDGKEISVDQGFAHF